MVTQYQFWSPNYGHTIPVLVTQLWSHNTSFGHTIMVTQYQFWSHNYGHTIPVLVTQLWSHNTSFGHPIMVTQYQFWSHNYGHTILVLVTQLWSHNTSFGHPIMVTQYQFWSHNFTKASWVSFWWPRRGPRFWPLLVRSQGPYSSRRTGLSTTFERVPWAWGALGTWNEK